MLLGNHVNSGGKVKIQCVASLTTRRKTKEKDRVEIDPEALSEAMFEAEKLSKELKEQIFVIGWYHSHPGYGCWLSGIDVST